MRNCESCCKLLLMRVFVTSALVHILYVRRRSCCRNRPVVTSQSANKNHNAVIFEPLQNAKTSLIIIIVLIIIVVVVVVVAYYAKAAQESLADAKVSARQQRVFEDPYRRNLQQICN